MKKLNPLKVFKRLWKRLVFSVSTNSTNSEGCSFVTATVETQVIKSSNINIQPPMLFLTSSNANYQSSVGQIIPPQVKPISLIELTSFYRGKTEKTAFLYLEYQNQKIYLCHQDIPDSNFFFSWLEKMEMKELDIPAGCSVGIEFDLSESLSAGEHFSSRAEAASDTPEPVDSPEAISSFSLSPAGTPWTSSEEFFSTTGESDNLRSLISGEINLKDVILFHVSNISNNSYGKNWLVTTPNGAILQDYDGYPPVRLEGGLDLFLPFKIGQTLKWCAIDTSRFFGSQAKFTIEIAQDSLDEISVNRKFLIL